MLASVIADQIRASTFGTFAPRMDGMNEDGL
jgi:hypothetical protein